MNYTNLCHRLRRGYVVQIYYGRVSIKLRTRIKIVEFYYILVNPITLLRLTRER